MATIKDQKSRHANTGRILIGGQHMADAVGIDVSEDTGMDPVHVIGTAKPVEHNHNRWAANVRIQRLLWKQDALNMYQVGGKDLLELPPFDVVGEDESDGHTMFHIVDVSCGSRSLAVNANTRISANISGSGLDSIENGDGGRMTGMTNPDEINRFIDDPGALPIIV